MAAERKAEQKVESVADELQEVQDEDELQDCNAEPCPKKRRTLGRRSSDEKVERAVAQRLAHLPECHWRGKVNKEGLTISEYVKRAASMLHGENQKLGTKFWAQVFNEYELAKSVADSLIDPPEGLDIDKDLLLALSTASSGNPAGSPSAQLERYLDHCGELNRAEVFGLFRANMEGPQLPRSVAMKCQVATLRYLARIYV